MKFPRNFTAALPCTYVTVILFQTHYSPWRISCNNISTENARSDLAMFMQVTWLYWVKFTFDNAAWFAVKRPTVPSQFPCNCHPLTERNINCVWQEEQKTLLFTWAILLKIHQFDVLILWRRKISTHKNPVSSHHLLQYSLFLPFKETVGGETESYEANNYDLWAKCRVCKL